MSVPCLIAPQFFQPRVASTTLPIVTIAHRIFQIVILVIFFRGIKNGGRSNLCHDGALKRFAFIQCKFRGICRLLLHFIVVKNATAILRTRVTELPVRHRGVDVVPEHVEQFFIRNLTGVINDLHRFGVTSPACRNLLIGRVFLGPADVSGCRRDHPIEYIEWSLHAPKASAGEGGNGSYCWFSLGGRRRSLCLQQAQARDADDGEQDDAGYRLWHGLFLINKKLRLSSDCGEQRCSSVAVSLQHIRVCESPGFIGYAIPWIVVSPITDKTLPQQFMRTYPYRLVNVFAESVFGGNPLCVFEAGEGLSDTEMQALALQFNLSETTFVLPSDRATARVRIFTPTFEMAFAGHPTLGSAHVVRELRSAGDELSLEMKAGLIPVAASGDLWTLRANAPTFRDVALSTAELAAMLGLAPHDVLPSAIWVNTGSEQLIIALSSADAVRRAAPKADLLAKIASDAGRSMSYVFAPNGDGKLVSRFFFLKHGGIVEDPGTGSATANLGGWFISNNALLPLEYKIDQGEAVDRACRIGLKVDAAKQIFVSGRVIEIGRGAVTLP